MKIIIALLLVFTSTTSCNNSKLWILNKSYDIREDYSGIEAPNFSYESLRTALYIIDIIEPDIVLKQSQNLLK